MEGVGIVSLVQRRKSQRKIHTIANRISCYTRDAVYTLIIPVISDVQVAGIKIITDPVIEDVLACQKNIAATIEVGGNLGLFRIGQTGRRSQVIIARIPNDRGVGRHL